MVLYPGIVLGARDDKPSGKYISDIIHHRVPATIFHHSTATYVYVGDVADAILRAAERADTTEKKYLLPRDRQNGKEYVELIRDVSGVSLPWFTFPDFMVMAASYFLTGLSAITRQPPRWASLTHPFARLSSKPSPLTALRISRERSQILRNKRTYAHISKSGDPTR